MPDKRNEQLPAIQHGHSVAAWTAVAVLMVAALIMAIAVLIAAVWLFVVGTVLVVVGVAVGRLLQGMGFGQQPHAAHPAPGTPHAAAAPKRSAMGGTNLEKAQREQRAQSVR